MKPFLRISLLLLALAIGLTAAAQAPRATAMKSISYTFVQDDGTNATSLVWVPSLQIYVTAIAGNAEFPLEAFNAKGEHLWYAPIGIDLRGMWWNEKAGRLEANSAGELGWYWSNVGKTSMQGEWNNYVIGQSQPDFQTALTFTGKQVVGFDGNSFFFYTTKGKFKKEVSLSGGQDLGSLNYTTVAYTGNPSYPLACLNHSTSAVVFFSLKGQYLATTQLPAGAVTHDMFRFAFANKMAWTYDADKRTWSAYQVF